MADPSRRVDGTTPLAPARKLLFLTVSWLFLAFLGFVAWRFILPAVLQGALHGYVLGLAFLVVLLSFSAAAISMTRDLATDRYP